MSSTDVHGVAERQFAEHLRHNPYPGRGLVIGRSEVCAGWLQIYWLMGRSPESQNRRLVADGGILRTEPIDRRAAGSPSLLIYEAMLELPGVYLVGNGNHTRMLYDILRHGGSFEDGQSRCEREPDAPHYTPRISGLLRVHPQESNIILGILKGNVGDPMQTDRYSYRPSVPAAGLGVGPTTYSGDGNPLPSFRGDPLLLPCHGSAEAVLQRYWDALNPESYCDRSEDHLTRGDTERVAD